MRITPSAIRDSLGLHGIELTRPAAIGRRGLERFFRHLELIGVRPATLVEICEPDESDRGTRRFMGNADYLRIDAASSLPVMCVHRNPGRPSSAPGEGMDRLCAEYGLGPPFAVLMEPPLRPDRLLSRLAGILPHTCVLGVSVRLESGPAPLAGLATIDAALRAAGFVLHECLDRDVRVHRGAGQQQLWIYAPAAGALSRVTRRPTGPVRNCLILGMGRSGTSLLGGILYQAGYYMGENLYPPRPTNPRGFFECSMINCLNEDILKRYRRVRSSYTSGSVVRAWSHRLGGGNLLNPDHRRLQGWLCDIPEEIPIQCRDESITKRIQALVARTPFCYKDPRFSYTLPVWRRCLGRDTVFICMFREPGRAVASILKECAEMRYLKGLRMDRRTALSIYVNMYRHVLRYNDDVRDRIRFVHYDQLLSGTVLPVLSEDLGVGLTAAFVDQSLSRTRDNQPVTDAAANVYADLCARAGLH